MPKSISSKLMEQATLYVMGCLSKTERETFEAALKNSTDLQSLMKELNATLGLASESFSFTPSEIDLQGQRNLLKGRILQFQREQNKHPISTRVRDRISRIFDPVFAPRQPIWAVASYVVLAFFIGQFLTVDLFTKQDFYAEPVGSDVDILGLIQSGALSNVTLGKPEAETGNIQLAIKSTRNMNVSGGMNDEKIQQILFYLLLNDANPGQRLKAVKLLEKVPSHENKKLVLVSSILSDPNSGIRLRALEQLSTYEADKTIIDACLKLLLEDENEAVRMGALAILAKNPSPKIVPVLRVVSLMDDNQYIQNRAREILAEMKDLAEADKIEVSE